MTSSSSSKNKKLRIADLKAHRSHLTHQQLQTLKGQILSGQPEAAARGLAKILAERKNR